MNEVKSPKKPLIYYYSIVLIVLFAMNLLVVPFLQQMRIREVDYGTFMTMTENKEIGQVEVRDNKILFTDRDGKNIYETGRLSEDYELIPRLYASGATFSGEIIEEMSPLLTILLYWILPVVIFALIGRYMSKKLMDNARKAR